MSAQGRRGTYNNPVGGGVEMAKNPMVRRALVSTESKDYAVLMCTTALACVRFSHRRYRYHNHCRRRYSTRAAAAAAAAAHCRRRRFPA